MALLALPPAGFRAARLSLDQGKREMTAVYHGGTQLDRAQAELDRHAVSSSDGLCVRCKTLGPCPAHKAAARVFALSARLPRRTPGATHPELIGARRVDSPWLEARAS